MIPARFKVIVTRRPKYACRECDGEVAQAPAPEHLIEGGIPTEALIAAVVIAKYADHLPLYRQAQIYGRQGVELDRSTLADWSGRAAFALRPVYERLFDVLKGSDKLFADETRAPVLDPGRRRLQRPPGPTRRRRATAPACGDRQTSRRQCRIYRPAASLGRRTDPFPGSAETAVWPRTTRTLLTPSPPSSPSPASNSPSGGSPGRRLLSQALRAIDQSARPGALDASRLTIEQTKPLRAPPHFGHTNCARKAAAGKAHRPDADLVFDAIVAEPDKRRLRGRADPYKTTERRAREVSLQMISTLILSRCTQRGFCNPEISSASASTAQPPGSSLLV